MHGEAETPKWVRSGAAKLAAVALGLAVTMTVLARVLPATAADVGPSAVLWPSDGAYLGAFEQPRTGENRERAIQRFESTIGRRAGIDHEYYQWNAAIPTPYERWTTDAGRIPFLNWKAPGSWARVASGAEDSWIVQRADAFKAFGDPIYLTFHHEPENDPAYGTPSDYTAAFRRVVDLFRARGVSNVAFVWTMMSWTFDPRSGLDPMAFYPGDGYVDFVGSDGYNWYPGKTGAKWVSFQEVFDPSRRFALAHGKPWMVVETGVQEDPTQPGRKGDWFRDMLATAKGWPDLKAIIYFDSPKKYPWWVDTSTTSIEGFREAASANWFTPHTTYPPAPSNTTTPAPSPTITPSPTPTTTSSPIPTTTSSPTTSTAATTTFSVTTTQGPTTTASPTTHEPDQTTPSGVLINSFNGGVAGWSISRASSGGLSGNPFDAVSIESGTELTYDGSRSWGGGLAAKVNVRERQDAFVEWGPSFGRPSRWYGRVYVRFDAMPSGDVRLVRAKDANALLFALDVLRGGRVRVVDKANRAIATTSAAVVSGSWARIEWMVDHAAGIVEVRVFGEGSSSSPLASARTSPGAAIGSGATQVQIGRSGSQQFAATFWFDEPGLSRLGFLGPAT